MVFNPADTGTFITNHIVLDGCDTLFTDSVVYKRLGVQINYNINNPGTATFNINGVAQLAAAESLKDKKFINRSIKHNLLYANKIKKFLEDYKIYSNPVSANFLFLDFEKCKYSAKYLYEKLKNKGIILRSTQDGYHINNKLRLTIGSKKENLKFLSAAKEVLN